MGTSMSIQRYEPTEWGQMDADAEGGWVTYADLIAMRDACIAAVEAYFARGEYSPAQLFDDLREAQP